VQIDIALDPVNVGLLGPTPVVQAPNRRAHLIEKSGPP
jgi:hypothetical protein